jgi:hypothetical protein
MSKCFGNRCKDWNVFVPPLLNVIICISLLQQIVKEFVGLPWMDSNSNCYNISIYNEFIIFVYLIILN